MITKDMIASLICKAFRDMDDSEKYEIGDGYYMVFEDGDTIYDYGVAVGKLDEDGNFDYEGDETEYYLIGGFCHTFDKLLTDGNMILDSMAGLIAEDYGWE